MTKYDVLQIFLDEEENRVTQFVSRAAVSEAETLRQLVCGTGCPWDGKHIRAALVAGWENA